MPAFQAYIDGASAGTLGQDENTWFSNNNPFNLFVVGAYGENTIGLSEIILIISVPQGERGTISFATSDETPSLLTILASPEPKINAEADILTDYPGNDGYFTKDVLHAVFSEHYPFDDAVSDFLVYGLQDFDNSENTLKDYNAADGSISSTQASGEQKEYEVSFSGFSKLHFDVYGRIREENGFRWEINPNNYDSAVFGATPEPATLALFGLGLLGMGALRKKE